MYYIHNVIHSYKDDKTAYMCKSKILNKPCNLMLAVIIILQYYRFTIHSKIHNSQPILICIQLYHITYRHNVFAFRNLWTEYEKGDSYNKSKILVFHIFSNSKFSHQNEFCTTFVDTWNSKNSALTKMSLMVSATGWNLIW